MQEYQQYVRQVKSQYGEPEAEPYIPSDSTLGVDMSPAGYLSTAGSVPELHAAESSASGMPSIYGDAEATPTSTEAETEEEPEAQPPELSNLRL